MHGTLATTNIQIAPAILYFGTPVVLIGSCNEDSSYNLSPMSSAWPDIMMENEPERIDPDKWRPLIMSFQQFYGLTPEKLQRSELGQIPESKYRPPGWQPAP